MLQMFKCIQMIHSTEKIWFSSVFFDALGSNISNLSKWAMIQGKCNIFWYFAMHWDHWYQMFQMFKYIHMIHGTEEIWCILVFMMHWDHWYQMFKCIQMNHDREDMWCILVFYDALGSLISNVSNVSKWTMVERKWILLNCSGLHWIETSMDGSFEQNGIFLQSVSSCYICLS